MLIVLDMEQNSSRHQLIAELSFLSELTFMAGSKRKDQRADEAASRFSTWM